MKELVLMLMLVSDRGDALTLAQRNYVLDQCHNFSEWAKAKPKKLFRSNKEWDAFIIGCVMGAQNSDDFLPGEKM